MRRRTYVIVTGVVFLLIGSCVWLLPEQQGAKRAVSLAFVSDYTNQPAGQATFRFYNDGARAVFLSWLIVEANTPSGWRMVGKMEPRDPRVVDCGKSTDLLVSVPADAGRWRVSVVYGNENRGPALLLTRVDLAIRRRSLSVWHSVGVFTGSSTVVSDVSR